MFRPNPIGLTIVELIKIENNALLVRGLDAFNLTPVLDIKPFYFWDSDKLTVPKWWHNLEKLDVKPLDFWDRDKKVS
jgi:tRNA (Thr-GGU) A37 N-methylase